MAERNGQRQNPFDPKMIREMDKRLAELEKTVPTLISRIDYNTEIMYELKDIMVTGNKEAMDFMRSVIGHEQNMDVAKQQIKSEIQKAEIELKRQKEEWERIQKAEQEKWLREQKAENRTIVRQAVTKILLYAAPILAAVVTLIVKLIEGLGK